MIDSFLLVPKVTLGLAAPQTLPQARMEPEPTSRTGGHSSIRARGSRSHMLALCLCYVQPGPTSNSAPGQDSSQSPRSSSRGHVRIAPQSSGQQPITGSCFHVGSSQSPGQAHGPTSNPAPVRIAARIAARAQVRPGATSQPQ